MKLAVMDPADWDRELVAHAASKRAGLCKREVMGIRRHAAAHKAWLPQHEFPVVLIAHGVLGRQTPMRPGRRLVRRIYGRHLLDQTFAKARG